MVNIGQNYTKNILYILGLLGSAIIYFCIYYWSSLETIFSTVSVSNQMLISLIELIIKNIWIWLIPSTIIDKLLKRKIFYSVGLNLDRFAIRDILCGITLALLSLIVIFGFIYFVTNDSIIELYFNKSQAWIIHNLWTINDAAVEEFIFRGFIFQNIFRKNNSVVVILISSFLFAIVHFFYAAWSLVFFVNAFLAGVLFCQMYAITKSLWSAIAFHSIWNIAIFNIRISNTNEFINIEFEYITIFILVLLIVLVNFAYKPSYYINKYFLLNS